MSACVVCGSEPVAHLKVAGSAGDAGLIPTADRYGTALADIVRCPVCGHMQLARFPAEEELSEAYGRAASGDYLEEERGQRATAAALLERIEAQVHPGRILDLGCWVGFLLAEARDRGWEGVGIEPSAFASAWARDNLGLDVRTGDLADLPEGETFEAVVLGDVIEHLSDPGAALERIRPSLGRDGVLALLLPDSGSRLARVMGARWWSVLPTHVQYFTRSSLARLLQSRGYAVLEVGTAPKSFTVRYYLGRIRGYSERLSTVLVRAAERARLANRLWAPDFRDRMRVIARPRA